MSENEQKLLECFVRNVKYLALKNKMPLYEVLGELKMNYSKWKAMERGKNKRLPSLGCFYRASQLFQETIDDLITVNIPLADGYEAYMED